MEKSIQLRILMAELFECEVDDITESSAINSTIGWDSLSHISLMMSLTSKGLPLSPIEIPQITSYQSIKEYIKNNGFKVTED